MPRYSRGTAGRVRVGSPVYAGVSPSRVALRVRWSGAVPGCGHAARAPPRTPQGLHEQDEHGIEGVEGTREQKHVIGLRRRGSFCFPSYQEPDSPLAKASIAAILQRISEVPSRWQTRLRNNGGGYLNHILYWCTMCQDARPEPEGELREAIEQQFSNFSNFQTEFSQEAAGLFGSGYVWLCETDTSPPELKIVSTQNQVWWHYRPGTSGGRNLTITLPPLPGLSSLRQAASTVGLGRVGTCLLSEAPE